ncbi:MAG TPA: hypothetical protein HA254_00350 [Candidatus Diapherotrites archaeon]|uniref:Uncharacterized protein n=1 Tax=Candidatus Iainarchaeum sp. TaxID=3101447 RepID=A0A7J4IW84_9ARCH|nr:hypothetical protein [Candidatus Diapherotrites archaeon]
MALKLIEKGFETEAFFLILATWNFATFRYAMKDFDIKGFKQTIENECNPVFEKLKGQKLETANFDLLKGDIVSLYNILSAIKGVKYTGASKLMHLKNPNLFVMWDGYIKKRYGFGNGTAQDYVEFLKKMQSKFGQVNWQGTGRTLAKAIDEYNYTTITLPELEKQRQNRKRK